MASDLGRSPLDPTRLVMSALVKSRGGLITWFRREPDGGLWIALSCATHRDWAIEWRFSETELALTKCDRATYITIVSEILEKDAAHSLKSCVCASPLVLT
jgi:hypothetical protein